jgi:hypothetical protein
MQGIESLDNFKSFVSSLGGLGRYEDTYIVHAAEGETVVPMEVLDRNPVLKKRLFQSMVDMGIEPGRYIVGHELNSKNPVTGQPEFFLKKIVSQIRKALPGDSEKYLGTIVGLATGNPFLGALAGGVGSGVQGALTGGLTGFQSPGIEGLGGGFGRRLLGESFGGGSKIDAMKLFGDDAAKGIFSKEGGMDFLFGDADKKGLFGKFDFRGDSDKAKILNTLDEKEYDQAIKLRDKLIADDFTAQEASDFALGTLEKTVKAKDAVLGGMSIGDAAKLYGLGTAGIGILLSLTQEDQDDNLRTQYERTNEIYDNILNMQGDRPTILGKAEGGVMDLRQGGESEGPGTGTSDDIPAMLSDGEFVMTAKAVRGAGGGDRREGAKRMYQMMDNLEARG